MGILRREWEKTKAACVRDAERQAPREAAAVRSYLTGGLDERDFGGKLDRFEDALARALDERSLKAAHKDADGTAHYLAAAITLQAAKHIEDGRPFWRAILPCKVAVREIVLKMQDMRRARGRR